MGIAPRKIGAPKPVEEGSEQAEGAERPTSSPSREPEAFQRIGARRDGAVGLRLTPGKAPVVKAAYVRGKRRGAILPYPKPLLGVVLGPKDSGKTRMPLGVPRPYGGLNYVLAFDGAAIPGITRMPPDIADNTVVIDLVTPVYRCYTEVVANDKTKTRTYNDDCEGFLPNPTNLITGIKDCGHSKECIYSGFDPNRPETAAVALDQGLAWLEEIQRRGDCDNLFLDHYQWLHEGPAESFIYYFNEKDPMGKVQMDEWNTRTKAARNFLQAALLIPRHSLWISGYDKREAMIASQGKKGLEWKRGVKDERWLEPVKRPFHVILFHEPEEVKDGDEKTVRTEYNVRVHSSKDDTLPLFPKGEIFDLTGTDYRFFWERYIQNKQQEGQQA